MEALLRRSSLSCILVCCLATPLAHADDVKKAPKSTDDSSSTQGRSATVDINELVLSAMKTTTSIQEAPAIITIVTDDQLKAQGHRFVASALGMIPGFLDYDAFYGWVATSFPLTRGLLSGPLMLRDGLDLFDTVWGTPNVHPEAFPLETIKRIEATSGPGGVMWGSNAMVGVVNIISKTADDLQGVEASAGYGTGPGRPGNFKAYAMGGAKLFKDRLGVFAHVSYQTWHAAEKQPPLQILMLAPTGTLQGPGVLVNDRPAGIAKRSHQLLFSGNAQLGPFFFHWNVPWARFYQGNIWFGTGLQPELGTDRIDCTNPANANICKIRVDPNKLARYDEQIFEDRQFMIGYRDSVWKNQLSLTAKAFFVNNIRDFSHEVGLTPSSLVNDGAVFTWDTNNYRVGANADAVLNLPWFRVIGGGEVFYDYLPEKETHYFAGMDSLPFKCPPDRGDLKCPILAQAQSDRLTGGAFLNLQHKLFSNLILDGGARLQAYGGKRSLSTQGLFSGAVVWGFLKNWSMKTNYAEGFRPPALYRLEPNVGGPNVTGNPTIKFEKSRAIQGELNGRLLRDVSGIKSLNIRADYSYTWVNNFIDVARGQYSNVGDIGIHSAEFLAQLTLKGNHWITLGYTFLDASINSRGKLRTIPNQWVAVQALFNCWKDRLLVSSNLTVLGSSEDPNRYIDENNVSGQYYWGAVDENGNPKSSTGYYASPSDITIDRVSPQAIWNAGVRFRIPKYGLHFDLDVYNLLNAQSFFPGDGFIDYTTSNWAVPMPRPGTSFFLSAMYKH